MESVSSETSRSHSRLRAMVEIIDGGQIKIFPIAHTDEEAQKILDSLLLWGRRHD